ncbi:MAG: zinc-ribbon domain-containing protein [Phycisphaeraceae bacterium]|nr:zinc-ribbon domain-containing protein [Phycisphaeraceae bacterium]
MSDPQERVTCPNCSKGYRWQSKLVGRKVPCKQCGTEFEVPSAPGTGISLAPVADDGTYELDLDAEDNPVVKHATSSNGGKCPSCNSPVRDGAVLCMNCGFNMAEGKKLQTAIAASAPAPQPDSDDAPTDRTTARLQRDMEVAADTHKAFVWQEYTLPIVLVCFGLAFALINALGLAPAVNEMINNKGAAWVPISNREAMIAYIVAYALTLVMMMPLLLGGIFFMAAVFGSAFGNLFTALLKLFALTVFVVSLDQMVNLLMDLATGGFGFIGWGIRFSVVFAAFYPICVKLFDMESHEIWVMLLIYVIGPIAIGMLAMMIAMSYM